MIRHIEFCLEEIECEIDAQDATGISEAGRLSLQRHIAQMRAVLATWQPAVEAASMTITNSDIRIHDKLQWVRGIDQDTAALLAAKGVTSFQTIAGWRHADIAALDHELLSLERIAEQNWIEQAAILVTGQLTLHAKQVELAIIANVEAVDAADDDTTISVEASSMMTDAVADSGSLQAEATAAALEPAQMSDTIVQPAAARDNIIALTPASRTNGGRRVAQVAATLAIIAAGIAALQGLDMQSVMAITAAVADQTSIN